MAATSKTVGTATDPIGTAELTAGQYVSPVIPAACISSGSSSSIEFIHERNGESVGRPMRTRRQGSKAASQSAGRRASFCRSAVHLALCAYD